MRGTPSDFYPVLASLPAMVRQECLRRSSVLFGRPQVDLLLYNRRY
jgi:hypothetical protein